MEILDYGCRYFADIYDINCVYVIYILPQLYRSSSAIDNERDRVLIGIAATQEDHSFDHWSL